MQVAREPASTVPNVELFTYPGDRHLFAGATLPGYDRDSANLLTERALTFVRRVG